MKKIIVYPLIFMFLLNLVSSSILTDLKAYYKLDVSSPISDATGTQIDAVSIGADFNAIGGYINASYNFTNGGTDKINLSTGFKENYTRMSWGAAIYPSSIPASDVFAYDGHNAGNQGFFIKLNSAGTLISCVMGSGLTEEPASTTYTLNKWQHIVCDWNGTDLRIYKDGNFAASRDSGVYSPNTGSTCLGSYCLSNLNFYGSIDEVFFYNRSLNDTEILLLNSTQYDFGFVPENATASVILNTNIVNSGNYSNDPLIISFNGTVSFTQPTGFNCSISDSLSPYSYWINFTNIDISKNWNFTINTSDGSTFDGLGTWNFNISCNNNNASNYVYRSNLFIDTLEPTITMVNSFNNSIYYRNKENYINFSLRANDLNLYAVNYTIYKINSSGLVERNNVLFNWFTQNMTGQSKTNYIVNYTNNYLNNLTWSNGKYIIVADVWDSHTDEAIEPYEIQELADGVDIEGIKITSSDLSVFNLDKEIDRYSFQMEFTKENPKIYIDCINPQIVENSQYKGHVICLEENKWIDFEEKDAEPILNKLQDGTIEVTLYKANPGKLMIFNSIGDLNTWHEEYYFNITNGFTFYAVNTLTESIINSFTITIFNSSGILQTESTSTGNLTFNLTSGQYNVNITSSGYSPNQSVQTFTSNGTLTFRLFIENSLLLNFYDEDTFREINNTFVEVEIRNLLTSTILNSSDQGFTFISGFTPGDYELYFQAPNYMPNSYFTTITSGSTQSIDLYLVPNATGSLIVFNLANEKGNPIKNATLKRKRFNINQNAFVVTGMSKSDSNGETSMNLHPNDIFYQFVVEKSGLILFSGTDQKVFSSTVYFRVPVLQDVLTSYVLLYDGRLTSQPIVWNNATNIISFTYDDISGIVRQGCILVIKRNAFSDTKYENCVNSSSATVYLNMTGLIENRSSYIVQGYIHTNSTYSSPVLQYLVRSFSADYIVYGNYGLYMSYILIMSLWFLGIRFSFMVSTAFAMLSMIFVGLIGYSYIGIGLITLFGIMGLFVSSLIKS